MTTALVTPGSESIAADGVARPRSPGSIALDAAIIFAILVAALAIRLTHIDANPSFDELWHIGTTKAIGNSLAIYKHNVLYTNAFDLTSLDDAGPFWAVWTRSMDGILHPPLFVTALRLWRDAFGQSDYVAHLFSVTWSLIAITFTFLTARLVFDRWLSALLALALACSQTQVYLAQEVRAYSMLIMLGAIALWLMTLIEVRGATRDRLVALGLLTLPLQLTHYFAFGGALAMVIFGVTRGGRFRRAFIASVAISVAVFLATWLKFAIRQIADIGTGDAFLHVAHRDPVRELMLALGTPFRLIAERDYQIEVTPVLSGVLFVLPWVLLRRLRALWPWGLWLCCTIGPLVALDFARATVHVAYVRYLSIATPAVPLLFAGVVWPIRRWLGYVVAAVVCCTGAIYLISDNRVTLDSEDFSLAARLIEPQVAPGDVIATYAGRAPLYYCDVLMLTLSHSKRLFPRTIIVLDRPMDAEVAASLAGRRVWLAGGAPDVSLDVLIPGARLISERSAAMNVGVFCLDIPAVAARPGTGPAPAPVILPP